MTTMETRNMGNQGLAVPAIGLGCMSMSDFYDDPANRSEDEAIATIHRALDIGVTFLDTADVYGIGHNERLVGRAIAGRRHSSPRTPSRAPATRRRVWPGSTCSALRA